MIPAMNPKKGELAKAAATDSRIEQMTLVNMVLRFPRWSRRSCLGHDIPSPDAMRTSRTSSPDSARGAPIVSTS